jgi:hypothetical protein
LAAYADYASIFLLFNFFSISEYLESSWEVKFKGFLSTKFFKLTNNVEERILYQIMIIFAVARDKTLRLTFCEKNLESFSSLHYNFLSQEISDGKKV